MRTHAMLRAFFILYCIEAGFFLLVLPWSPGWDRTVVEVPAHALRAALLHPLVRGAVSGFGLVHLVWSLHDLNDLIFRRLGLHGDGT
jgi:hypothetical protein